MPSEELPVEPPVSVDGEYSPLHQNEEFKKADNGFEERQIHLIPLWNHHGISLATHRQRTKNEIFDSE